MNKEMILEEDAQKVLTKIFLPLKKIISFSLPEKKKSVLVIAGPTACGKTNVSLMLAKKLSGEI